MRRLEKICSLGLNEIQVKWEIVKIDLHLTSLGEASCWIREDDEVTYRISKVLYLQDK